MDQRSSYDLDGPILKDCQVFSQTISQGWVLLRGSTEERAASKLSQVVGRINFLVVLESIQLASLKPAKKRDRERRGKDKGERERVGKEK